MTAPPIEIDSLYDFDEDEKKELFNILKGETEKLLKLFCRNCSIFFGHLANAGLTMAKKPCSICPVPKFREDWELKENG